MIGHKMPVIAVAAILGLLIPGAASAQSSKAHVDKTMQQPVFYPKSAQAGGEQGNVYIAVYVRSDGKPVKAAISKSSGYDDLDTAAVQSALNWTYVPAMRSGDRASGWTTVQVVYKLPQSAQK